MYVQGRMEEIWCEGFNRIVLRTAGRGCGDCCAEAYGGFQSVIERCDICGSGR